MTRNPFALARAARIRTRADRLKAELNNRHDAAPNEFLRGDSSIVPGAASTRLSGVFITGAPKPRRPHRATGKPVGRPRGSVRPPDTGLAGAVYALMERRGVSQAEAIKTLATVFVKNEGVAYRTARNRVYKALRH